MSSEVIILEIPYTGYSMMYSYMRHNDTDLNLPQPFSATSSCALHEISVTGTNVYIEILMNQNY